MNKVLNGYFGKKWIYKFNSDLDLYTDLYSAPLHSIPHTTLISKIFLICQPLCLA